MAYRADDGNTGNFYDGCIRTYGAATRLMTDVWQDVVGEPMAKLSGSPKSRFREALRHFEDAIRNGKDASLDRVLRNAAVGDDILKSLIDESLDNAGAPLPEIDDVPPSVFKEAVWAEAMARTGDYAADVELEVFLRGVVTRVVESMNWSRRFNVGKNRHFPRMLQWLLEVQDETTWDDGTGLRLMNRAGKGRVARFPSDPRSLKIRIQRDWL